MGMVCFLNTGTMETESLLSDSYPVSGDDEYEALCREIYDKVDSWEHFARIDPPESRRAYQIMEDFIENCIPDKDWRTKYGLMEALSKRKPFQNFKYTIDNSPYRQSWFNFRQIQLEEFVRECLDYHEQVGANREKFENESDIF
jgi:hypothetical protein